MRLQLGADSYRPPCDNLTVPDAHGRPVRTTAFVSVPHIRYIHVCAALQYAFEVRSRCRHLSLSPPAPLQLVLLVRLGRSQG
jgi:hypothetical protein